MGEHSGKFIVFEGLDGSGKSTQISRIGDYLNSRGIKTSRTSEPQPERPVGEFLRRVLSGKFEVDPRVTAALFAADRIDHVTFEHGVAQMLDEGCFVLCDRYYLSNYAYNSDKCPLEWVMALNEQARQICKPDLHVFIDVPVEVAVKRIENRKNKEIFEVREELARIRKNYLEIIDRLSDSENVFIVDGTLDSHNVFMRIREIIDRML